MIRPMQMLMLKEVERAIDDVLKQLRGTFDGRGSFRARMSLEQYLGKLRQRKREVEWA